MKLNHSVLFFVFLLLLALTAIGQPTLQFSSVVYTVAESAGSVTLIVQRGGDTNPVVGVDYATVDGTATSGLKYVATNGTLTFAAGMTNQIIVVPILDDGFAQGTKTFKVILSNPTGGSLLGSRTNANVSITDNRLPPPMACSVPPCKAVRICGEVSLPCMKSPQPQPLCRHDSQS